MAENEELITGLFMAENKELIAECTKYPNMRTNKGIITTIEKGPTDSPKDTTLKIEKDDGHEYNLTGPKAHYAVTQPYHGLAKPQEVFFLMDHRDVYFLTKEDTNEIAVIFMKTVDDWASLRLVEDLCKLSLSNIVRG